MAAADSAAHIASSTGWFLARYMGVVMVFYVLSLVFEKAGFVARLLASWIALVCCALYGVVASIVLRLLGKSQIAQWATARSFKYTMAAATGVRFRIDDPNRVLDTVRPAVFVGNHQTALDVLMLGCMFPQYCSITAKTQLKYYPFLGWFMQLSGSIFIDRANSKDARQAMSGAADAIRSRRQSVFMFPEGTRSNAQEAMLLPFKKGAFHLAVQAGVPIVPIAVANYSHVYSFKKLIFRSGTIPIKVLDPIPTTGLTADDVPALTESTRDLMLKEITALTAEAQGQPIPVPVKAKSNGTAASMTTGIDTRRTRRA